MIISLCERFYNVKVKLSDKQIKIKFNEFKRDCGYDMASVPFIIHILGYKLPISGAFNIVKKQ